MDKGKTSREIGQRIRERRIELGLSQEELAKRMGNSSRASVSTVETGKEDLTTTRIKKFAKALEVDPSYIMGWNIEKPFNVLDDDVYLSDVMKQLNEYHKKALILYAEYLLEKEKEGSDTDD